MCGRIVLPQSVPSGTPHFGTGIDWARVILTQTTEDSSGTIFSTRPTEEVLVRTLWKAFKSVATILAASILLFSCGGDFWTSLFQNPLDGPVPVSFVLTGTVATTWGTGVYHVQTAGERR